MKLQSLYYTIIKPKGDNYVNEGKLNGHDFVFNTQIDRSDYTYTNRIGIVVAEPAYEAPYKEGQEVLVHHNVFRQFWNNDGHLQGSGNAMDDGLYYANGESIFAYRNEGEEWTMIDGNLLVRPLSDENGHIPHIGQIHAGKGKGDTVLMNKNCEYEFWIDDDLYYKVREKDIAAKIL